MSRVHIEPPAPGLHLPLLITSGAVPLLGSLLCLLAIAEDSPVHVAPLHGEALLRLSAAALGIALPRRLACAGSPLWPRYAVPVVDALVALFIVRTLFVWATVSWGLMPMLYVDADEVLALGLLLTLLAVDARRSAQRRSC